MSSFNKQRNNKTPCNFPSFCFPQNKYFSVFAQVSLRVGLVVPIQEYLIFKFILSFVFLHFELFSFCSSSNMDCYQLCFTFLWNLSFITFPFTYCVPPLSVLDHFCFSSFSQYINWISSFFYLLYVSVKCLYLSLFHLFSVTLDKPPLHPAQRPTPPTPTPDSCLTAARSYDVTPCYKYEYT